MSNQVQIWFCDNCRQPCNYKLTPVHINRRSGTTDASGEYWCEDCIAKVSHLDGREK